MRRVIVPQFFHLRKPDEEPSPDRHDLVCLHRFKIRTREHLKQLSERSRCFAGMLQGMKNGRGPHGLAGR